MFRQQQKQMSAYEKKTIHDIFLVSIEWLEKYIEIAYKNEFPDWENRKQVRDNLTIKRTDIYQYPKRAEATLSSQLHLFEGALEDDASPEFREELKQEFYKWLSATGVNANNCPERLKHFVFGFNEILEGRGEKIRKDIENRKRDVEIDSPEYLEKMQRMYSDSLISSRKEIKTEESLRGKTHKDMEIGSKFGGGNVEQGEKIFKQIAGSVAGNHGEFHFKEQQGSNVSWFGSFGSHQTNNPQQRTNFEIVQDVIQNGRRNWRLDEIVTGYNHSEPIEESVLIHNTARLENYEVGKFDGHPIYKADRFSSNEIEQIKRVLLGISQTSFSSTNSQRHYYFTTSLQSSGSSVSVGNKDKDIEKNKVLFSVGIIGVIAVISVIAVRKYFKNRRSKW
jgi:hypothetical protein